jgi:two-component system sensor histidine kinase BaeS
MSDVNRQRGLSLAWKLLFAFLAVALVSIGTVAIISGQSTAREVRGFVLHGEQSTYAVLLKELESYYQDHGAWEGAQTILPGSGQRGQSGQSQGAEGGRTIMLADASGEILFGPSGRQGSNLSLVERSNALSIEVGNEVVGYLAPIGLGFSNSETQLFQGLQRAFWVASLIAGVVALLLGLLFVKGMLRPVNELTDAARALAGGDLSRRVEIRTNDEVGELSMAFNQMAEHLELSEERRRETTADIAHELRNPLAVMKARLEAIIDGVHPLNVDSIEPILEQSELLNHLVEDLRTLDQADAGQLSLERSRTDLGLLVQKVVDTYRPEAQTIGITLIADIPPEPSINGIVDTTRFEQILGNLITNALRHTPEGGEVKLRLRVDTQRSKIVMEVIDSGEGIPAQDLERIFERLYRVDPSRSRKVGGSGLGLAITRKLVEAHDGLIRAENRSEGGAIFRIELPG